jgi:cytochrome c biogenesis protein CcdA
MEVARVLLAFTAGVLSPLSPCSLPLLPSYIAYYLSAVETERLRDALILAATTLLGFLSVYILISLAPSLVLGVIPLSLKLLNLFLGVLLLLLCLAIFLRGGLTLFLLPHPTPPKAGSILSFYLFGVVYALSSLSCSLPVFILLIFASAGTGLYGVMPLFASFALGCGALLLTLSLAVCYSKVFIIERVRGLAEHMPRITASVLIIAGLYMALTALLEGVWS